MDMIGAKVYINIILIVILITCLFKMPYGFYQLARFTTTSGFIALLIMDIKDKRWLIVPIYTIGAITFNPVFKLAFRRNEWQLIDKITVGVLLVLLIIDFINLKNNKL